MALQRCVSQRRRSYIAVLALSVGVLFGAAGPASAATTIGQVRPSADSGEDCNAFGGFIEASVAASTPAYAVPSGGVITSWSTNAGPQADQLMKLKALRLQSGTTYMVVGDSGFQALTASTVNTLPADIPVRAGDVISVKTAASGGAVQCLYDTLDTSDAFRYDNNGPDSTPSETMNFTNGPFTKERLNVSATITGPPTSAVSIPVCPSGGPVTGTVIADTGTRPKTFHYRLDGGPETIATTGSPGTASITLPAGVHTLQYWGEDQVGQQETTHHTATVGCPVAPGGPAHVTAAQVSNPSESNSVFAASPTPKLVTTARKHGPVGTTFKYTLDKPASVRFDFTQRVPGRKVNGMCVAQNRRNKRKHKCTRTVIRGTLNFAGHAGQNSVRFFGWLSKHKKLKPGKYTLVITATTPGVGSTTQKLTFKIAK